MPTIESPGISRVNGPAKTPTPTPPPLPSGTAEEIQQRLEELAERTARETEALRVEQARAVEQVRPVHLLLHERHALIERIEQAKIQKAGILTVKTAMDTRNDAAIGGHLEGRAFVVDVPTGLVCDYIVARFDAWLAARNADLAAINAKLVTIATERNAAHLLPPELAK